MPYNLHVLSPKALVREREALLRGVAHRALARLTRRGEAFDERLTTARKDVDVIRRVPRREGEKLAPKVGPPELDAHAGGGGSSFPFSADVVHCGEERVGLRLGAAAFVEPGILPRDCLAEEKAAPSPSGARAVTCRWKTMRVRSCACASNFRSSGQPKRNASALRLIQ